MKIGLIAQPHRTGLGIQQWEFARHMNPAKVLITDLSRIHAMNSRNNKRVTTVDWFDEFENRRCDGLPTQQDTDWLLKDIDLLFVIETPLRWEVFQDAREHGVKSVLQYNHEFLEYFIRPKLPKPDLLFAPSPWNIEKVRQSKFGKVEYLPVPIATDRIKRRKITQARKFVHIVGHKAHEDRNGTEIVKKLAPFVTKVRSLIQLAIHDQSSSEVPNYWDLYSQGDVLVLPRSYGGLSLQVQEAAAAGMPVILEAHDPYASEPCAVPIEGNSTMKTLRLRTPVMSYKTRPLYLAQTIERLVRMPSIESLSDATYEWAMERSWDTMASVYEEKFRQL